MVAEGATLVTLSLSDVNDNPSRPRSRARTLNYTASVVNGVGATTTVTRLRRPATTVALLAGRQPTTEAGHQVTLAEVGDTTINLAVTAGDVTTFYTIVITRERQRRRHPGEPGRWQPPVPTLSSRVLQAHL